MTIQYSDPFNNSKFGKLKGEKTLSYLEIWFDEGKLYKTDDGYMLAAHFTGFEGVTHSFKEKTIPEKGLVCLPVYAKDYEVRQSTGKKDDNGKWVYENVKQKASLFERWLCQQIEHNPSHWLPDDKHISGNIAFIIDPQVSRLSEQQRADMFATSYQISSVPASDKLPKWEDKKNNYRKNGYGNGGITLDEKVAFLKKDLIQTIGKDSVDDSLSVGQLVLQLLIAFPEDEAFLACYLDLLKSLLG